MATDYTRRAIKWYAGKVVLLGFVGCSYTTTIHNCVFHFSSFSLLGRAYRVIYGLFLFFYGESNATDFSVFDVPEEIEPGTIRGSLLTDSIIGRRNVNVLSLARLD